MQHSFSYEKNKVIQGVRYHFVQDRAVKILVILITCLQLFLQHFFIQKKLDQNLFY